MSDSAELLARSDPESVKALAAAVVENAIGCACATSATWTAAERADAVRFLTAPDDDRLELWCAPLDLDADAVRDGCRRRLRRVLDDAA